MKERFSIAMDTHTRDALDAFVTQNQKFSNRSQAIEYCVRFVLEFEAKDKNHISFLLDFLDVLEEQPDISKKLRLFLRDEEAKAKK